MKASSSNYYQSLFLSLSALRASLLWRLNPTSGKDHGQTAIQIAQPDVAAKKGIHLSKSTYHFSTPRTICFSSVIANGGHAFSQTRHLEQKSSIPNSRLGVNSKGASVSTAPSLNADPNSGLIIDPCLPNSPKPHSSAGGIINSFNSFFLSLNNNTIHLN